MTVELKFQPKVIGHRGACAYAPENTIISFIKAAQLGVKWVEFDVMQAACGEPIIFHDEALDRTSNGHGNVDQYPYSYLRTLDAGAWFDVKFSGEKIPTLQAMLTCLQQTNLCANIEIKALPGTEEQLLKRVITEMKPLLANNNNRFIFSSFSMDALHLLRKYAPNAQLGILLHEWEPDWESICQSLNCVSVHVNHEIMTPEAAKRIKAMNKSLLCYTVNERSRARELYGFGVDAVFTDAPDKIMTIKGV